MIELCAMDLVEKSDIPDLCEILPVGIFPGRFPDVDTLKCKIDAINIAVPAFLEIISFINQHAQPIKNL